MDSNSDNASPSVPNRRKPEGLTATEREQMHNADDMPFLPDRGNGG